MNKHQVQKEGYPKNLLMEMKVDPSTIFSIANNAEKLASLEYVMISVLSKREYEIMSLYWKNQYTMQQIGSRFDITVSRIGTIIDTAARKLRKPTNLEKITQGIQKYYKDIMVDRIQTVEFLEKGEDLKKQEIAKEKRSRLDKIKCRLSDDIDILNLSVRARNALNRDHRNNIWSLYITSFEDLEKIRNLGVKSSKEILIALEDVCGITLFHDKDKEEKEKRVQVCVDLGLMDPKDMEKDIWLPRYIRQCFY